MNDTIETTPRRPFFWFMSALYLTAVCMTAAALPAESDERAAQAAIQPDVAVQYGIQAVAEATDEQTLSDGLIQVRRLIGDAHARLVSQLLLYVSTQNGDIKAESVAALILKRLDVPREAAVSALVPYIDLEDTAIRETVRALLREYEDRSAVRPPDFSAYRAIIEAAVRAGDEPSPALFGFMYASDPGAALLAMMRSHQLRDPNVIKPILWGEHRIAEMLWKRRYGFIKPTETEPEALRQLEALSRHAQWWVRLYAAEMCRRHAELCSPELRKRLSEDTHPLVREAILAAEPAPTQK